MVVLRLAQEIATCQRVPLLTDRHGQSGWRRAIQAGHHIVEGGQAPAALVKYHADILGVVVIVADQNVEADPR
ncbi:hypothetical protein D3C80_1238160 [compost metagenome]